MPVSSTALPLRAENPPLANQAPTFTLDDRHWCVRGLEKQLSCERLKVNLMVTRRDLVHVDSLDLYSSRMRQRFIREAAAELLVEEATIKKDLGHVLLQLEALQERLIQATFSKHEPEVPVMTEQARRAALELLEDPRPLSVLIQSSSGAGKTTLQDAVLRCMPPEHQVRLSALTAQSLYYMGRDQLKHKILAVAEEEGVGQTAYALKLLQSEGRVSIACAGRDADTGRQQTEFHQMEGPVAMLLTTTAQRPDEELANRCFMLRTNEQPAQTAAINDRQRAAYGGQPVGSAADAKAIETRHQNAQRLLEPLGVVIPCADRLTFRADRIASRRDNAKYLGLIASITLLHQYQRKRTTRSVDGAKQVCVVATLQDVAVANRLAGATLARSFDALMPRTRRLLTLLSEYVVERAAAEAVSRSDIRFTQRQLRTAFEWNDRTLRRHLGRLVELEYVAVYRSVCGNGRTYQLLDDATDGDAAAASLGLIDPRQLRNDRKSSPG